MPQRVLRDRLIELEVPSEDVARGRALRKNAPRRALAQLTPSNRTATEILVAQNAGRLSELVPLRFTRMLADPFAFYRDRNHVLRGRSHLEFWHVCCARSLNSVRPQ
jgi:hypothetical protein